MRINQKLKEEFIKKMHVNEEKFQLDLSLKNIKEITKYYKENYKKKYETEIGFNDFLKEFPYQEMIENTLNIKSEIEKQFEVQKALQPGVVTECFVAKKVAEIYGFNECVKVDLLEKWNTSATQVIRNKINDLDIPGNLRYIFWNSNNNANFNDGDFLAQLGDNKSTDLFYYCAELNDGIKIEVKEHKAKFEEFDFIGNYNNENKFDLNDSFLETYPDYEPFADYIREKLSKELIGSNIKIANSEEDLNKIINIITERSNKKNVFFYIIIFPDGKMISYDLDGYIKNADSSNSEIRTVGKNVLKIFDQKLFEEALDKAKAKKIEYEGKVAYEIDNVSTEQKSNTNKYAKYIPGRGKNEITSFKIFDVFKIKKKYVNEIGNNKVVILEENIKQIKPTISIHMFFYNEKYKKPVKKKEKK